MHTLHVRRILSSMQFRSLSIGPNSLNLDTRTVSAVVATENPVPMFDWQRMEVVPEVLLMNGAILPDQVPLLDSHQWSSVKSILGSVRQLHRDGRQATGQLTFSSVASKEFTQVAEGHLTDVSIGYQVLKRTFIPNGSSQTVAGRAYAGPVNVVTSWRSLEVSLTSIGADEQAKLRGLGMDVAADVQRAMEEFSGRGRSSEFCVSEEVQEQPETTDQAITSLDELRQIIEEAIKAKG